MPWKELPYLEVEDLAMNLPHPIKGILGQEVGIPFG